MILEGEHARRIRTRSDKIRWALAFIRPVVCGVVLYAVAMLLGVDAK